jgi:hypothetical protein
MHGTQKKFSATLRVSLKKRFDDDLPQANMLARLYNMRCEEKDAITEDTMRGWLDGETLPSEGQLTILQAWLGL